MYVVGQINYVCVSGFDEADGEQSEEGDESLSALLSEAQQTLQVIIYMYVCVCVVCMYVCMYVWLYVCPS